MKRWMMTTGPAKISALIFDFDGVIVDSSRIKHECYVELAESLRAGLGSEIDRALSAELTGAERSQVVEWMVSRPGVSAQPRALLDQFRASLDARWDSATLVPGIHSFLRGAGDAGLRLGVSSAAPEAEILAFLADRELEVDLVYGAESGTKVKSIQRACDVWNIQTREVLFFGDMPSDRAAAIKVGCHFIRVNSWAGGKCSWDGMPSWSLESFEGENLETIQRRMAYA